MAKLGPAREDCLQPTSQNRDVGHPYLWRAADDSEVEKRWLS